MAKPLNVLLFLAVLMSVSCAAPPPPKDEDKNAEYQERIEKALQNANVQILRKQLEQIPQGTPGRGRVVAHLEDMIAKEREAAATREQELLVCDVQQYIESDPKELYAALEKRLGPDALGIRAHFDPYWVADAKFPAGKMQVYEQNGLLDQINIWFDSPVPRDDALMMFGFPVNIRPTEQGPFFFVWERTFGIDRLHFLRVRGKNEVKEAMIEIR